MSRWLHAVLAVGAIGIFSFIAHKAKAANRIANHDAAALAAWQNLHNAYSSALDGKIDNGWVKADKLQQVVDAWVAYGNTLHLDGDGLNTVEAVLRAKIDTQDVW